MQDDFKRFLVKKIKTTLHKTGLDSGEISGSLQELESLSDDLQTLAGLLRQTESPGDNFFLQEEAELSLEGNPEEPGNLLIEGDNLPALKLLAETHRAKIDVIYIDPPYNTGKRVFIYDDKFTGKQNNHGPWLSFMGSRLYAAKNLLSPEGVIFISIDDNEHCRLKILCDDIFGENNFVGTIIHQRAKGGGQAKYIVRGHDYILVYASRIEAVSLSRKKVVQKKTCIINGEQYIKNNDFLRKSFGKYTKTSDRRCFYEEIEQYKGKGKKEEIDKKIISGEYFLEENGKGKHIVCRYEKISESRSKLYSIIKILSEEGKKDLEKLGITGFDYPKPVELVKFLVDAAAKKDSVILDFFAGSGTTGHAVLRLNAEDGGHRSFILCTNNENNICRQITRERIRRAMEAEHSGGDLRFFTVKRREP